ncbi:MAG: hypothetical protein AB7F64_09980 [Gammaproteobacteria bacterium]
MIDDFNSVLCRLYTNKNFRDLFYINAELALNDFKLQPNEKLSLIRLDKSEVESFSESLKYKLLGSILRNYGLLFLHYYEEFFKFFERAYELLPKSPSESLFAYNLRIGEYFLENIPNSILPRFVYDLTNYLVLKLKAKLNLMPIYEVQCKKIESNHKPILYPTVYIQTYQYDPEKLLKILESSTKVSQDEVQQELCSYLISANGMIKVFKLSEGFFEVMSLFNGSFTLKSILEFLKSKYHYTNDDVSYIKNELIPKCVEQKWIYFT